MEASVNLTLRSQLRSDTEHICVGIRHMGWKGEKVKVGGFGLDS